MIKSGVCELKLQNITVPKCRKNNIKTSKSKNPKKVYHFIIEKEKKAKYDKEIDCIYHIPELSFYEF